MADNGGHYDPRVQAMEEIHFDWRCIVCCMVALSPLHLEQQHLPGTESVYFDLDNTPWVKCDKCHTPFHLQCGTWESLALVRNKHFLCTFFLLQRILGLHVDPCRLITLRPVLLPRLFWHLSRLCLKIHVVDLLLCRLF